MDLIWWHLIVFGFTAIAGSWMIVRALLLLQPAKEPYCPRCGYVLMGLTLARCPECGTDFTVRGYIPAGARAPTFLLPLVGYSLATIFVMGPVLAWLAGTYLLPQRHSTYFACRLEGEIRVRAEVRGGGYGYRARESLTPDKLMLTLYWSSAGTYTEGMLDIRLPTMTFTCTDAKGSHSSSAALTETDVAKWLDGCNISPALVTSRARHLIGLVKIISAESDLQNLERADDAALTRKLLPNPVPDFSVEKLSFHSTSEKLFAFYPWSYWFTALFWLVTMRLVLPRTREVAYFLKKPSPERPV